MPEPAGSSLKQTRSPTSSVLDCSGVIPLRFRYRTGRNVRGALPNFRAKAAWSWRKIRLLPRPRSADRNPVSGPRLPKMGIFRCPAGDFGRFRPERVKIRSLETRANSQKPAIGGPFCHCPSQFLRLQDWLAGDAVLIAPVSTQIPCQQGILQGNLHFWALRADFVARNRCAAATFHEIPYAN